MCEKKVKAGTRKHNKSKLVEKRLFVLSILHLILMKENDTEFGLQCSGNFFRLQKNRNKLFMCIYASQLLHNFQIVRELTTFLKHTKVSKIQLAVC